MRLCPKCNTRAELEDWNSDHKGFEFIVRCMNMKKCGGLVAFGATEEKAIKAWNEKVSELKGDTKEFSTDPGVKE